MESVLEDARRVEDQINKISDGTFFTPEVVHGTFFTPEVVHQLNETGRFFKNAGVNLQKGGLMNQFLNRVVEEIDPDLQVPNELRLAIHSVNNWLDIQRRELKKKVKEAKAAPSTKGVTMPVQLPADDGPTYSVAFVEEAILKGNPGKLTETTKESRTTSRSNKKTLESEQAEVAESDDVRGKFENLINDVKANRRKLKLAQECDSWTHDEETTDVMLETAEAQLADLKLKLQSKLQILGLPEASQ